MFWTPWYQNVNNAFWFLVLILMADQLKSLLPRPRLSILPSIWEDHWVNYTSQSVYILLGDIVSVKLSWYMTYIWKNILCTFLPSIYPSKWIHRIRSWKKWMRCITCMDFILRSSFTQPKIDQVNAFPPCWLDWSDVSLTRDKLWPSLP